MAVRKFKDRFPKIDPTCFIEDSAQIIGDVEMGEESSVWFNSVIRGDVNSIKIGKRTNIQDLCVVHVAHHSFNTVIGDDVTVGHHVVLHGCRIGNRVLIGMGAILMDGVVVGDDCIVAAGALLAPGTQIAPGSLALGSPAKVKRRVTDQELHGLTQSASNYVAYAKEYATHSR